MSSHPSAVSGVLKRPFDEQVGFFRRKLGNLVPTERWDDLARGAHDLGFMVAGATKADLLTDLATAVERTIAEGQSIQAFRADFRAIVERRGWHGWTGEGSAAGERWRTRVIYQTNLSTSYAAGRYRQLEDGGYDLWVYKHSGSQEPRPEHLAWDGLTLPKDHPFWRTHAPKNGWGCECYVVGARSEAGARRLGGKPGQEPPEGWDRKDPRTGAPPGIDRGWDYRPGKRAEATRRIAETLAPFDPRLRDMAIAMAEKVRKWDYQLAKAYMQGLPERARDAQALAYRALPSVMTDVRRYARRIIEGRTELDIPQYKTLGSLTTQDVRQAARVNPRLDLAGYDFTLDPFAVRHIQRQHGNAAAEAARGQRAVTADDYRRLPRLINEGGGFEDVGLSRHTQAPLLSRRWQVGDEEWVAIFDVRRQRRMLGLETLYIRKGRQP